MISHRNILAASVGLVVGVSLLNPLAHNAQAAEKFTVTYPYYGFIEDPDNPWGSVYDALDETGTIEYSDTFFDEPSAGEHPELRALSYALALAGYENLSDGYPIESDVANPKLWDLLNQLGFHDYEAWDVSSEIDGHSMGTTIAEKTLMNGEKLVVVAPRNYNYMTEWLSNFNVGTSGDHAGFAESASLITDRLSQYITSRNLSNYKLWIVGYSRGGAVVDLAAKYINADIDSFKLSPENLYAYTFGAPKASVEETQYSNIHDVKDGNDLLLGYVFPELWGFYNTGVYEEIHPADLEIGTSVVDISDLTDSSRALNLLSSNEGLTKEVGKENGKEFMDDWFGFMIAHGLTREYFNSEVKSPLSAIMQLYQLRTLDKQSEFTDFLKNTDSGLAGMVAGNAFADLLSGTYPGSTLAEILDNFPPYQDLVKILRGTAVEADIDDFISYLSRYMGEYEDYEDNFGEVPKVTMAEYSVIKENLPKLVKALAPLIVADAKYTQDTFGSNYSLYYTYSLASNFVNLVYGHIPESIMPILKSLIVIDDEPEEDKPEEKGEEESREDEAAETVVIIENEDSMPAPAVPNTGDKTSKQENTIMVMGLPAAAVAGSATALVALFTTKKRHNK